MESLGKKSLPSAAWGITRRSVCTDRPATASRGENRMAIAKLGVLVPPLLGRLVGERAQIARREDGNAVFRGAELVRAPRARANKRP